MKTTKIWILVFILAITLLPVAYADESVILDSIRTSPEYPIANQEFNLIVSIDSISVTDANIKLLQDGNQLDVVALPYPGLNVIFNNIVASAGENVYEIEFWDVNFLENEEITDVTRSDGSDFGPISIKIYEGPNIAPEVNIYYPDIDYYTISTINFDGIVTDVNSDDSHTYQWEIISKPAGSSAILIDDSEKNSSFEPDLAGEYEISFTATDERGLSDSGTVKITVLPLSFTLPISSIKIFPEIRDSLQPGESLYFSAEESSDPDGEIVKITWIWGDETTETIINPDLNEQHRFGFNNPGYYHFTLIVEDDLGLTSKSIITLEVSERIEEEEEEETPEPMPRRKSHGGGSTGSRRAEVGSSITPSSFGSQQYIPSSEVVVYSGESVLVVTSPEDKSRSSEIAFWIASILVLFFLIFLVCARIRDET